MDKERIKHIIEVIMNNENSYFLTKLSGSLYMNLLFAIFKFTMGIYYRSVWFFGVGVYYLSLCFMRIFIHAKYRESLRIMTPKLVNKSNWMCCLICGISFFGLDLIIAFISGQMIYNGHAYYYPGILIYLCLLFALYCLYCALRNLRKYRSNDGALYWTSKNLDLVACLMSMYALSVAFKLRFPQQSLLNLYSNVAIGTLVCIVILILALRMIIKSIRHLVSTR